MDEDIPNLGIVGGRAMAIYPLPDDPCDSPLDDRETKMEIL